MSKKFLKFAPFQCNNYLSSLDKESLLLFLAKVYGKHCGQGGGNQYLVVTDEDQWAYQQGFGVFGDIQCLRSSADGCCSAYHLRRQRLVLCRQRKQFRVKGR